MDTSVRLSIAIVIPVFDCAETIECVLDTLFNQLGEFQQIVKVNNA